jgi:hypothetical protein
VHELNTLCMGCRSTVTAPHKRKIPGWSHIPLGTIEKPPPSALCPMVAHQKRATCGNGGKRYLIVPCKHFTSTGPITFRILPLRYVWDFLDCTRDIEQAIKIRPVSYVLTLNGGRYVSSVQFFHINLIMTLADRFLLVFNGIPGPVED